MDEKKTKAKEKGELIYQKIPAIMAELSAIGKKSRNDFHKYNFRGIDDVYNAIHPILAEHKVFTVPEVIAEKSEERESKQGGILIYRILTIRYCFYAEDGSHVDAIVVGEAMDSGDKAGNKALSAAHKYALLQVFCIPTEEPKDTDLNSPDPKPRKKPSKQDEASKDLADMSEHSESEKDQEYPKDIEIKRTDGTVEMIDQYGALAKFKALKAAIGEEAYCEILNGFKYEKSNQIKKSDIPVVYAKMVEAYMGT